MTPRHSIQKVTKGGIEWWQHTMNRMVQCRTIPALLDLAYDAIRGGLGYDHVGVFLADPTRRLLVEVVSTDDTGRKAQPSDSVIPLYDDVDESLLSDPRLGAQGPGFLFTADGAEKGQLTVRQGSNGRPAPTLYVALRTPEAVLGLFAVANLDGERAVTPADAPPLVALATALAPAVHNIALHEDGARRARDAWQPSRETPTAATAATAAPTPLANESAARLLDRPELLAHLDRALDRAAPFAVALLAIDNVTLFKDTYGPAVGDRVLHDIATMLRHICRDVDVVGQYGDNELAVVLRGMTGNEDGATIRRLQRMVAARPHIAPDGAAIPVVLATGMAYYPLDGRTRQGLIAMAEASLSAATRGGRGRGRPPRVADLPEERYLGVLTTFITAIDAKDHYTREHSEDVARWALRLADAVGMDAERRRVLALAGALHDVGKVAVPDRVLRKPGKLTREEYAIMRHHVSFGVAILRGVIDDPLVIDAVAHHHERWDGQGYPGGLSGEQVSLLSRIMQIADAVSAMLLDRPYRQGLPWARVTAELRHGAGRQFDPALVEPFIHAVDHPGS